MLPNSPAYLADVRALKETFEQQLQRGKRLRDGAEVATSMSPGEREHLRDLIRACDQEIARLEGDADDGSRRKSSN